MAKSASSGSNSADDYASKLARIKKELNTPTPDVRWTENLAVLQYQYGHSSLIELQKILDSLLEDDEKAVLNSPVSITGPFVNPKWAVLRLNRATAAFRRKQYGTASLILEACWRNIEPQSDKVAMAFGFLYLEVIGHTLRSCSGDGRLDREALKDGMNKAKCILMYLLKEKESFNSRADNSNDAAASQVKNLINAANLSDETRADPVFQYRTNLYKTKIALWEGKVRDAKKALDATSSLCERISSDDQDSMLVGFLESNLLYLEKNYTLARKVLQTKCRGNNQVKVMVLNNLGCVHHQMKQPRIAQAYFTKALEAAVRTTAPCSNNEPPFECEILCNLGLQLFRNGHYEEAFNSLLSSVRLYHRQPKIWFRIGECCIAIQNEKHRKNFSQKSMVQSVLGSKSHRRVLLRTDNTRRHDDQSTAESSKTLPTLLFAVKCFHNVLALSRVVDNASGGTAAAYPDDNSEGADVESKNYLSGRMCQSALIKLSYLYLSLSDPCMAIVTAKKVLSHPVCSAANRYLAHTYCAEALILQSKVEEANADHLSKMVEGESANVPPKLSSVVSQYARIRGVDTVSATAGAHINLSTLYLLQNNLQLSFFHAEKALGLSPNSQDCLRLMSYLLLRKQQPEKALQLLSYCGVP